MNPKNGPVVSPVQVAPSASRCREMPSMVTTPGTSYLPPSKHNIGDRTFFPLQSDGLALFGYCLL